MTKPNPKETSPPTPTQIAAAPAILAPELNPPTPWERWKAFWFPKSDPTTLAFIRICTGLLVFYIHLAHSLDLQAFFGKQAWYATKFIDRERREGPSFVLPFFGDWNEESTMVNQLLSEYPHRRQAFMDFLRGLPADKNEREAALKYLNRINEYQNPDDFRRGILFIQNMQSQPVEMEKLLKVLSGEQLENESQTEVYKKVSPPNFLILPQDERLAIAREARAFWTALGKVNWSDSIYGRIWVFNYFNEVSPPLRKALVEYINKLPEDPTERKKLLDYLEYWNSDPRSAYMVGHGIFSVWFHVSDPTTMALIHAGVLIMIAMFTIGLFTRVTSVLVWVATIGYLHRTQQILFGMDTMMNILLFYLMMGCSGAALSVDRLIARYRATRASLRRSGTIDGNTRAFLACPQPSTSAGFAIRLIQVHFCFIYMAAGLSKLKGSAWWDGRAFWDVIANPEFTLMPYSWYEGTLRGIARIKPLYYSMNSLAVWTTLFVEIATPFLLWTRLRWLMILLAAAMHAVIGVLMGLNLFELLMIVMLIAFFPDRVIRDRFRGAANLARLVFTFNPQNQKHARAAALAVATDIDNQITLNADKNASVVSVSPGSNGNQSDMGQGAVRSLFQHLRLTSLMGFVLWIPGIKALLATRLFPSAKSPTS
jgi:hypothetical protein